MVIQLKNCETNFVDHNKNFDGLVDLVESVKLKHTPETNSHKFFNYTKKKLHNICPI